MNLVLSCIAAVIFITGAAAQAADIYVRKGATGIGTSWADAYGELNRVNWTGVSNSTLWITGGSYTTGLPTINVANVRIQRATIAFHGTNVGWSDAYDNLVQVSPGFGSNFLGIGSGADGLVLDGVGFNPWKFKVLGVRGYNGMLRNDGADAVTIRGIEFDGLGEMTGYGGPEDGLRWGGGRDAIIEHNYIHDYRQVGESHNDGVQGPSCTNITFRYNVFKNNGMHVFLGDVEWNNQSMEGSDVLQL